MSDKDFAIADAIRLLVKEGYSVTYEAPPSRIKPSGSSCASDGCKKTTKKMFCSRCRGQIRAYLNGEAEGAQQEQARIIELLEDETGSDFPQVLEISLHTLIALIKGETE